MKRNKEQLFEKRETVDWDWSRPQEGISHGIVPPAFTGGAGAWEQWVSYVKAVSVLFEKAKEIQIPELIATRHHDLDRYPQDSILLFSPHPDDEAITGTLPLRLAKEGTCKIINVPMTLGSDDIRKATRFAELKDACKVLGFFLDLPANGPFSGARPEVRNQTPDLWLRQRNALVVLLRKWRPVAVLYPHKHDGHPTHEGVNLLAMSALQYYTSLTSETVFGVETQCWLPMDAPNLLVGLSLEDTAHLAAGIACHQGEVARNPYHALLPLRLIGTMSRGSEILKGFGSGASTFVFGELYRISRFVKGVQVFFPERRAILSPDEIVTADIFHLFPRCGPV